MKPIGILFEHPHWFEPLFAELDRRNLPYQKLRPDDIGDTSEAARSLSLVMNRMSPSAWLRGNPDVIFSTAALLAELEGEGLDVVNGHRAFAFEISKAKQLALFESLGLRHPRARVIETASEAVDAAEGLSFPVMVKPNVGGSGAGIESFETRDQLANAASEDRLELGPDHRAVVQEHLPARGEEVIRVEVLGGEFLYAIRLALLPGSYNLCPADYCDLPGIADGVSGRGLPIEVYSPPPDLISEVVRIADAMSADLAGVEYLINDRDGLPYFYDINALSNFVADAGDIIGFDPFVNLVDLIADRAGVPRTVAV